jgi:hypothetical protein
LPVAPAPQIRIDLAQHKSFAAARMAVRKCLRRTDRAAATNVITARGAVQSSGQILNFENQVYRMDRYLDLGSIGIMTWTMGVLSHMT